MRKTCPGCNGQGRPITGRVCTQCYGRGSVEVVEATDTTPDLQAEDRWLVLQLVALGDDLSEWSRRFVVNLDAKMRFGGADWRGLTDRQRAKANEILMQWEE